MKEERFANIGRTFVAAIITAVMTLTLAFGLSALLGGSQRQLADRVDRNTAQTRALIQRLSDTREAQTEEILIVLCRIAEGDGIHPAVCP